MGLRDYKQYKKEQELKESETISLLIKRVEFLEKEVEELKNRPVFTPTQSVFTDAEAEKIKKIQENKTKPEEIIKMFSGDLQEFNPNV